MGKQGLPDTQRGVPRWPGAGAEQDDDEAIGWAPNFLDYLFVSFTTSATFGPTDTPVLSRRGKVLTVVQCMLSLVVVIVLVAWAVDTL